MTDFSDQASSRRHTCAVLLEAVFFTTSKAGPTEPRDRTPSETFFDQFTDTQFAGGNLQLVTEMAIGQRVRDLQSGKNYLAASGELPARSRECTAERQVTRTTQDNSTEIQS